MNKTDKWHKKTDKIISKIPKKTTILKEIAKECYEPKSL